MKIKKETKKLRGEQRNEILNFYDDDGKMLAEANLDIEPGVTRVEGITGSHGYGSKMMQKILRDADRRGDRIELDAVGIFGTPVDDLVKFYGKFGFKEVGGRKWAGKAQAMKRESTRK